MNLLKRYNINCQNSGINSTNEWCIYKYTSKNTIQEENCSKYNYVSGFYNQS
jgi:hypothetical protein